ncbi:OppA family ABC transporter substrate-binding lipoprotein [Mycoplasma sp. 1932B]|uniref:OppA family ABC transporter substrate-binding lipoprotein n=1 Tax=Mycoplasma sp. 1932B TaxID=3401670 RepID=UPI003AAE7AE6
MKKKFLLLSTVATVGISLPFIAASCDNTRQSKPIITNENQLQKAQKEVAQYDVLAKKAWNEYSKLNSQKDNLLNSLTPFVNDVKDVESKIQFQQNVVLTAQGEIEYYKLAAEKNDFDQLVNEIKLLENSLLNLKIKDFLDKIQNMKLPSVLPEGSDGKQYIYNSVVSQVQKASSTIDNISDEINKNQIAIENVGIEIQSLKDKLATLKDQEQENAKKEILSKISELETKMKTLSTTTASELVDKLAAAKEKLEVLNKLQKTVGQLALAQSFANDPDARNKRIASLNTEITKAQGLIADLKAQLVNKQKLFESKKATIDSEIAKFSTQLNNSYEEFDKYFKLIKKLNTDIYEYDMNALDKTGDDKLQGTGNYLSKAELENIINPDFTFSSYPVGDKIAKARVYQVSYNSSFGLTAYPADNSSSYGTRSTPSTMDTTTLSFISIETLGRPNILNKQSYNISEAGVAQSKAQKIISPEVQRYKLELADAIYVYIPKPGSDLQNPEYDVKIFDQDDAGLVEKPDNADGSYSSSVVIRTSSNPRSINSKEFASALEKAAKIAFRIRPGQFWVNAQGQKTQYPINSNDFYTSVVRTYMNDAKYRTQNGGNSYIDEEVRKLLTIPGDSFSPNSTFPNVYIYKLFNVNIEQMLNKSKTVIHSPNPNNPNETDDLFMVSKYNQSSPAQFMNFFQNIATTYDFVPAPSTYIADMTLNNTEDIYSQVLATKNNKQLYDTIVEAVKSASGQAREAGIYWYGFNPETTLFAGKYYAKPFDSETFSISQYLNPYYFDTTYTGSNQTITKFTTNYLQAPIDPETYKINTYNKYIAGGLGAYNFNDLTKNNKEAVQKNPSAYGMSYKQVLSNTQLIKAFIWNLLPKKSDRSYMSDAFAYAMYGVSNKELMNGNSKNIMPYTTLGLGGEFRNIISSSIAWASIADQLSQANPAYPWITSFAPDANLNANASDTSLPNNSLRPNHDIINGTFVVDAQTGERIVFDATNNTFLKPSDTQNLNVAAQDMSKSVAYEQMKQRMKKLLDKVYAAHPEIIGQKVKLEIMWSFGNITQPMKQAYQNYADAINGLDDRLEFKIKAFNPQERNVFFDYWFNDTIPFIRVGWSYDYNGIGSAFTAYAQSLNLTALFASILTDEQYANKVKKSYPQFYKAAQSFKEFVSQPGQKLSVSLEDIAKNLTTDELNNMADWLGNQKFVNGQLVNLDDTDNVTDYITLDDLNAKFWLQYNNSLDVTKKDLLELAVEMSNISGAVPDMFAMTASKSPFAATLTNPNYILPTTYNGFIDQTNYRVVKEKTK